MFLLLTGLRRNEGVRPTWDNVDLVARTFTIPDPKNREPHTLPLSDCLHDLLNQRAAEAVNDFVFPGPRGGYLADLRDQLARAMAASEVPFIINDLRRTFITVAEGLDIPGYTLKQLINHKMSGDVTAGYIVINIERLHGPIQRITDYVLGMAELKKLAEIVTLDAKRATQSSVADTIIEQSLGF